MKRNIFLLAIAILLIPLEAFANPAALPGLDDYKRHFLFFCPAIFAEIALEIYILRLTLLWKRAAAGILLMHFITVPLLWQFLTWYLPQVPDLSVVWCGEFGVVLTEATCFFVIMAFFKKFRQGPLRCLIASLLGNAASFLLGLALTFAFPEFYTDF